MEDIIPKLYKGYKVIMRLLLNIETSVCYTLMLSVAHDVTDYEFGIELNSNSRLNSNHTK